MLKLSGAVVVVLLVIVGVFVLGHSLSDSAAPGVFDGVSLQDMSQQGVTLLEENPADAQRVSRDEATRSLLGQLGLIVEASELVSIDIAPGEAIPPRPSGRFTAWAVRLDTSGVPNQEYFGPRGGGGFSRSANPTIVFVDAATGDYLREYFVSGAVSPTATPFVGTQPPTYP